MKETREFIEVGDVSIEQTKYDKAMDPDNKNYRIARGVNVDGTFDNLNDEIVEYVSDEQLEAERPSRLGDFFGLVLTGLFIYAAIAYMIVD